MMLWWLHNTLSMCTAERVLLNTSCTTSRQFEYNHLITNDMAGTYLGLSLSAADQNRVRGSHKEKAVFISVYMALVLRVHAYKIQDSL